MCHIISLPCNHTDAAISQSRSARKRLCIRLSRRIGHFHAAIAPAMLHNSLDFRQIALNHIHMHLVKQAHHKIHPKTAHAHTNQVKHNRNALFSSPTRSNVHRFKPLLRRSAYIQVQPIADTGDLVHLLRRHSHNRPRSTCQLNICHIIDSNHICDVVNQRTARLKLFYKIIHLYLFTNIHNHPRIQKADIPPMSISA